MEDIKNKINYIYSHLFNMPKHPFFYDINTVERESGKYIESQKEFIDYKIEYKKTPVPKRLKIKKKYEKVLDDIELKILDNELKKEKNFNNIYKIVSRISNYLIKSTVKNETKLYNKISEDNRINVMIIGAGPIGLFLACYLDLYYNKGGLNNYPKVNVVLYDNRLKKAGLREPYTRQRPFSTHSQYLSLILPKLYCLKGSTNESLFINIFVLEYLLYTKARLEHKIPMIYSDYDWNDYKNIIKKGNFKVVFDCTGGKLKTDLFNNISTKWMNNIEKVSTKINKQLLLLPERNLVHLIDYPKEKKFKKNHFYSSLIVLDEELNYSDKIDIDINDEKDLLFLKKIKKNYYNYNDIMSIIYNIHDDHNRNFLYNVLLSKKYKNKLFYFDLWAIYIRHTIQPAELVSKDTIYIKAGDSLFHSHFITGAGLNRTISFAVKCANLIIDAEILKDTSYL